MTPNLTYLAIFGLAGLGLVACSAANESPSDSNGDSGGSTSSGNGGQGGTAIGVGGSPAGVGGGSTSSGPDPVPAVTCPKVAQEILILDFRSGWWSGGGGGQFHQVALKNLVEPCPGISAEYHHFEVQMRVKCLYATSAAPNCQELFEQPPSTPQGFKALFEKPSWDDYTQIWILSGSEQDATDVALTGALFDTFLGETKGSCIPVLVGAGDGFITHGNSVTTELGMGNAFSTEFAQPGFFSVAMDPAVTVGARMYANKELQQHILFTDVDSIADTVSNSSQSTHGDSIAEGSSLYQIIAHDSAGRPAIAIGAIQLPNDGERPFIIDSGFQRYYGMADGEGTKTLLQNMVKYLGNVGCKADGPK